ncbi:3'-5' exoribonuclease HELZ2-like [Ptychodera flava]|uniref:3'-5' exoribonuclease HELZ2-like n=1 Tax=Ptychodera flava TaxID=63121 RepID=UPI00396A538B
MDPTLQKIACIIDEHSPRLMAPLNRTLPKMIWVTPRSDQRAKPRNSIPICTFTKARKLNVKRYEKVSNRDRPNKVFLVRYLRWHPRYRFPVCVVIDVLPYGDTLATGTEILKMAYGVKASYKTAAKQELARLYPDKWSVPPLEYRHRENLQHLDVFTVDPAESTDLDDALSMEPLGENRYRVGIHIADVSFFVHCNSELDKDAFRRATSHYPWKQNPIHMLPSQLSTKLCSLIPDEDRLALTLFLTLSDDAVICEPPRMCRSIIKSRANLSYKDAENVINGVQGTNAIPQSVQESIGILHRLTCKLQAKRLGDGQFCCRYETDDVAVSPQSHSMVEELLLLANMQVANLLVSAFPNCTPLRRQKSPRENKLTDWKTKHRSQIPNSLDIVAKSELLQLQEFLQSEQAGDVDVLNTTWEKIVAAIQVDDTVELRKLLLNDLNHPQLAIMSTNYWEIQERAIYIASNNTRDERSHFSLNVPEYTHFTSPIRRYIDIVVHRLVIAYLASKNSPYSEAEIKEICDSCNQQASFAKEFEQATMVLHVATTLRENPIQTLAFISSTTDEGLTLHVPEYNRQIPAAQRTINFSTLQPCQKPVIKSENTPVTLEWKQRIYTYRGDLQHDDLQAKRDYLHTRLYGIPILSPERYVKHIPGSMWREMMASIVRERRSTLRTVLHRISVILNNPSVRAQPRLRQKLIIAPK